MKISITNTRFTGQRFISVESGSSMPDIVIRGSTITAEDVFLEERDSHQAGCQIYHFPTARR